MSAYGEYKELMQQYDQAKSDTDNWRSTYDIICRYIRPNTNPVDAKLRAKGDLRSTHVYDTTAIGATINFASKMQANLTPPFGRWANLEAGSAIPDPQKYIINTQLELITQILFRYIQNSNFDLAINEMYYDLAMGTGALLIQEGSDDVPLDIRAVSPIDIYPIESDVTHQIETVWMDFDDTKVCDIKKIWPKAVLTTEMKNAEATNPNQTFNLCQGIIYQEKDSYRYVVINKYDNEALLDIEIESSPWIVPRWSKSPGEVLGRGPAMDAWPAISDVNQLAHALLLNSELNSNPTWLAAGDGIFNPKLHKPGPGVVLPISKLSVGQPPIQRLDTQGQNQTTETTIQDLRQQINNLFFVGPLRPVMSPPQTATEISIRQQALLELIGPAFGRLERELLSKIINRALYILQKKGFVPKALKANNQEVGIKYRSALSQSSDLDQVQSFQNMYSILQNIAGPQQALMGIRAEVLPEWLADRMGVDANIIKPALEIQSQALQSMQAQQQAQQPPPSIPPTQVQTGKTGAPQIQVQ